MLTTFGWRHLKDSLSLLKATKDILECPLFFFFPEGEISKVQNSEIPSCHQNLYIDIEEFSTTKQT